MKPPDAIGSVPSLSGHAIAYRWRSLPRVRRHRASKPQGSSERVLPWQITMDQLIFASLSHTHYWYEVGMLKVPVGCNKHTQVPVGCNKHTKGSYMGHESQHRVPYVCVCVCVFSSHSFWTSIDVPAGVTQEEGNTGFSIHLLSAVLALIFLARRIQPFLSLVDREVEFCVLTI